MSDVWSYDPGYRPDDPRHGLSPRELTEFYNARPTQWLIRCTYGSDGLAKRDAALPAHISYLSARKDRIFFVGPILAGEGFNRAGMFREIEIKRFVETSLEKRRQLEMTPEPGMQLFICEMIDGSNGTQLRKTTGPAHHQYQKSVMDRFIARGPMRTDDGTKVTGTTYIIQVKDRAAAEALIAAEPMTKAGVFAKIRIDRWRFGKS